MIKSINIYNLSVAQWLNTAKLNTGNKDTPEILSILIGIRDTSLSEKSSEITYPSNLEFLMSDLETLVFNLLQVGLSEEMFDDGY